VFWGSVTVDPISDEELLVHVTQGSWTKKVLLPNETT
jgi:hypothetical protein